MTREPTPTQEELRQALIDLHYRSLREAALSRVGFDEILENLRFCIMPGYVHQIW